MKRKILCFLFVMCIGIMTTCYASSTFSDLPESHWANDNITKLVEKGIVNGYPDGTFKPEKAVTRAEFIKLLLTTLVGDANYFNGTGYEAIHWGLPYYVEALDKDYLMPGTEEDSLDKEISRLEMIHILFNVCANNDLERETFTDTLPEFSDLNDLDEISQAYIITVAANGFVNGYPDGTFKPDNIVTRAECATIITRFLEIFE